MNVCKIESACYFRVLKQPTIAYSKNKLIRHIDYTDVIQNNFAH